ncbi:hypothetical protein FJTKL_01314 [Diaporthe vaccinii]|uniref:Zn(2)-C6 fungal-type domain-containing protein n=2 Tax=Diaporthe vaccinii TaxID=105482 RepID=A0ABR4E160_9PEZI
MNRAANSSASRLLRRSPNACERCRKQKIRCSGCMPCDACTKRNLACHFNERHRKVVVTQGYIHELQKKASRQNDAPPRQETTVMQRQPDDFDRSSPSNRGEDEALQRNRQPNGMRDADGCSTRGTSEEPALTNFLATDCSTFMTANNGMTFYLGSTSNWTFTQKILSMVYERVFRNRLPDMGRNVEGLGNAYDLQWDGAPTCADPLSATVPTIDHAIYLINAVKFHCAQLFHVFDEDTFMPALYAFYENPSDRNATDKVWLVHFMVILAFGKGFTVNKNGKDPPGVEYFIQALQMLPNMIMLWRYPVHSVEVLTCISLYLCCLDYRIVAHNFMGQAMRLALNYGLHTNIRADRFGSASVERIRRAWWTVFILDREMTAVAGLPQSIEIQDVYCQLPAFSGSVTRISALKMQLKLSQLIADINRNVYGVGGRLNSGFQSGIKGALADIAGAHEELQQWFPLCLEQKTDGISKTSAYLHLEYHRCIILATRPLLFCFLKLRLESREDCQSKLNSSRTSRNFIQTCLDSSIQILTILESLLGQSLIDPFLPFSLDQLSAATINVLVAIALDHTLIDNASRWITASYSVFDDLITSGNQVAVLRKGELDHLRKMLEELNTVSQGAWQPGQTSPQQSGSRQGSRQQSPLEGPLTDSTIFVSRAPDFDPSCSNLEIDPGEPLTTTDLMDLANSIDDIDIEWISQTIGHDRIW